MTLVEISNLSRPSAPWEVRRRELLSPPPERVWKALTEPAELCQWWCDQADVDCRQGGRYAFSGDTVFGDSTDSKRPANFEVISCREPEILEFHWWLGGVETRVRYELTSHLAQTILTVVQSGQEAPCWEEPAQGPNWWWVALPALRSYLDDGRAKLRLDYPGLRSSPTISLDVNVSTFPWIIWTKLTDPDELERWWAGSVELETQPPGRFLLEGNYLVPEENVGPRQVMKSTPGAVLAHDWHWRRGTVGRIEWTIEERDREDTRLSVTDHGPWDPGDDRNRLVVHWASTLLYLQQMSEKGITPREYQDG